MNSRLFEVARGVYKDILKKDGYVNPFGFSEAIHRNPQEHLARVTELGKDIITLPTSHFLYTSTQEALSEFRGRGDDTRIWTDDYIERPLSSGILTGRGSRSAGEVTLETAIDKMPLLPALYQRAQESGVEAVIVVDDNVQKLHFAAEIAQEACALPVQFVLKTNGKDADLFPWDFPVDFLPIRVISDIGDLIQVRESVVGSRGNVVLITDFNYTLLETNRYIDAQLSLTTLRLNGHMMHRE